MDWQFHKILAGKSIIKTSILAIKAILGYWKVGIILALFYNSKVEILKV